MRYNLMGKLSPSVERPITLSCYKVALFSEHEIDMISVIEHSLRLIITKM